MINRPRHLLLALFTGVLAFGLCPARADDAEAVKEKLFQAKKAYDAEVQKFKKAITDQLDKREDDARKAGNKKQVDQIKVERDAFEKTGELPQMVPSSIREPVTAARTKLDKAYTTAVKEYLKSKMDDAADATEKERQEFILNWSLMFGKKTYLASLKHFDVKVWNNTFVNNGTFRLYENDERIRIKIKGDFVPHSIFLHTSDKEDAQVKYPLGGKWTAFRATIGVPKIKDNQEDPFSPLIYEVLGDGKPLWKSEPVTKIDAFQICTVNVEKVKTLMLRIQAPEKNGWAWTFWIEPILVE
jgi:hypothetical protein